MAEIIVKYAGQDGMMREKSMYVAPTSPKILRRKFDMYLTEVVISLGSSVEIEIMFNNKTEKGKIQVLTNNQQKLRWYTETLFCELHGDVSEKNVFIANRMHINLSKGLREQKLHLKSNLSPTEARRNAIDKVSNEEKKQVDNANTVTNQPNKNAVKEIGIKSTPNQNIVNYSGLDSSVSTPVNVVEDKDPVFRTHSETNQELFGQPDSSISMHSTPVDDVVGVYSTPKHNGINETDPNFSMYSTEQIISFMMSLNRELAARESAKWSSL